MLSVNWSGPRERREADGEKEEVVVREGGVSQDKEQRGRRKMVRGGGITRVAKKNKKGVKRERRWTKVNFKRTMEALRPN